jgi:hypothetical protein
MTVEIEAVKIWQWWTVYCKDFRFLGGAKCYGSLECGYSTKWRAGLWLLQMLNEKRSLMCTALGPQSYIRNWVLLLDNICGVMEVFVWPVRLDWVQYDRPCPRVMITCGTGYTTHLGTPSEENNGVLS